MIRGQYSYQFLDVFGRKIVGSTEPCGRKQRPGRRSPRRALRAPRSTPDQVILHSDNGDSMKGATMLAALQAQIESPGA
jgi:hypothetical protein